MLLQRLTISSGMRSSLSSFSRRASSSSAFTRCSYSTKPNNKVSDPLRILFCGSDVFSCYSLKALHAEHKANPGLIKSIDVMVRPGKAFGRGYKEIRQVPIQNLAEELSLPIHIRDTFTGWSLPQSPHGEPINLIVAVSFGLFVPPRILNQAKYGGLNVHPSLLPDLRGPAPLHHALLNRLSHTGVSLQTLSPQTFDAGTVIAQTPLPGIPIPPACTVSQLHDLLAPLGADMLVSSLQKGLHVPPLAPVIDNTIPITPPLPSPVENKMYTHAPKITKADQRWSILHHSAADAALRARVCGAGSLWASVYLPIASEGSSEKKGTKKEAQKEKQLEYPLNYPHPLEESAKGSPKRIILEDVSELFIPSSSVDDDAGLEQKYESYRRIVESMNSGNSWSTEQLGLEPVYLPQSHTESPSDPLSWLLRLGEDEYVHVETTTANGEKVTERKPRVSWALCTRLGLDGGKEEDKGAVTFVIPEDGGKFGLLRVGKIKVEGKGAKPARQVMKELAVKAG
ncbi:Formyltransferase [Neurospora crassa]|uniref:methionyl-tRNA formyltransferase n=1 Tax=Neurospora crassa (strain ATCC 24698 / 74-OR23-1A / CBS 708.71 / DSM 1257 / FGSC 987) TaxID=367110 RepID=Q7S7L3_NEUCR|nr:methionyl-tRNA formyltransferase [Neurospora crassa OR74A]EAA31723.2 methionyl-tRNA formyltransferase [Neurospora crassa OR74A]KHE82093.1 Formyltransferase [Neurospora crassa]|eukprot:XP_960959.2 methionyl-tRNA formyltransferase [Neurospora crassa OR74A]